MVKVLYKTDSKGKLRIKILQADGDKILQKSGISGGKLVMNIRQCHAKNVGKSNETTPEEQALSEIESKFKDELTKGYFRTKGEAIATDVVLPMLAKDAKKEMHKVVFPCSIQPKLDGMRSLGHKETIGMMSRTGKPIATMGHILDSIDGIQYVLDGELYAHGLSFQENMKIIKKYTPPSQAQLDNWDPNVPNPNLDYVAKQSTEDVKYHVYDIISDLPFIERYEILKELVNGRSELEIVPTYVLKDENDLRKYHSRFIAQGYEGSIIRWGDEGYKTGGRSSHLLKYKDFIDVTAEVLDVIPSERRPEQGIVTARLEDGSTFNTGMKFSHAEREEILINKSDYIGLTAEIRFFEYTDDGLPRFPVCVGFRLDK